MRRRFRLGCGQRICGSETFLTAIGQLMLGFENCRYDRLHGEGATRPALRKIGFPAAPGSEFIELVKAIGPLSLSLTILRTQTARTWRKRYPFAAPDHSRSSPDEEVLLIAEHEDIRMTAAAGVFHRRLDAEACVAATHHMRELIDCHPRCGAGGQPAFSAGLASVSMKDHPSTDSLLAPAYPLSAAGTARRRAPPGRLATALRYCFLASAAYGGRGPRSRGALGRFLARGRAEWVGTTWRPHSSGSTRPRHGLASSAVAVAVCRSSSAFISLVGAGAGGQRHRGRELPSLAT